jgi:hypothetical protein
MLYIFWNFLTLRSSLHLNWLSNLYWFLSYWLWLHLSFHLLLRCLHNRFSFLCFFLGLRFYVFCIDFSIINGLGCNLLSLTCRLHFLNNNRCLNTFSLFNWFSSRYLLLNWLCCFDYWLLSSYNLSFLLRCFNSLEIISNIVNWCCLYRLGLGLRSFNKWLLLDWVAIRVELLVDLSCLW